MADANLDISKGREVLPKNVRPIHYDLTLEPNLETFQYEGKVIIEYVSRIRQDSHLRTHTVAGACERPSSS